MRWVVAVVRGLRNRRTLHPALGHASLEKGCEVAHGNAMQSTTAVTIKSRFISIEYHGALVFDVYLIVLYTLCTIKLPYGFLMTAVQSAPHLLAATAYTNTPPCQT